MRLVRVVVPARPAQLVRDRRRVAPEAELDDDGHGPPRRRRRLEDDGAGVRARPRPHGRRGGLGARLERPRPVARDDDAPRAPVEAQGVVLAPEPREGAAELRVLRRVFRNRLRRGYIAATLARRGRTRSAPSCLVVFRRFGSLLGVHAAWSGPARGVARAFFMSGASPALCPLFAALSKKQLRGSPLRAEGEYTVPRNRPVRLRFVLGRISERFWCLQTIVKPPSFTGHRVLVRLSHHSGGFVRRCTWGLIDPHDNG